MKKRENLFQRIVKRLFGEITRDHKLMLLYMIFGISLVIANVIAPKLFDTGVTMFGRRMFLTAGIVVYPITFLITDVIGELWGKEDANRVVRFGFLVQILATIYVMIAWVLPARDSEVQAAYTTMLGMNWLIMIGSLTAYMLSQSWDVFVFHRLRRYFMRVSNGNVKLRFVWNNLSTLSSQLLDSTVFVTIVFGFGFGWLFDPAFGVSFVLIQIVSQYLFKLLIALIDTPIFLLLTRRKK